MIAVKGRADKTIAAGCLRCNLKPHRGWPAFPPRKRWQRGAGLHPASDNQVRADKRIGKPAGLRVLDDEFKIEASQHEVADHVRVIPRTPGRGHDKSKPS